jgi:hypothetical protein
MIGEVGFTLAGIGCFLLGLFSSLIVFGMFQRPGGIGAEKLVGPLVALLALGLFFAGGLCLYVANRLRNLHTSRQR